jgi:hypothetical protein
LQLLVEAARPHNSWDACHSASAGACVGGVGVGRTQIDTCGFKQDAQKARSGRLRPSIVTYGHSTLGQRVPRHERTKSRAFDTRSVNGSQVWAM